MEIKSHFLDHNDVGKTTREWRAVHLRAFIVLLFLIPDVLFAQSDYSYRGHWLGARTAYIPTGPSKGMGGVLMYEYRFDKWWSSQCDLSAVQFPSGLSFILGASMRVRIPLLPMNKNIYGLVGLGSGSMYPVLYAGAGIEYGVTRRIAVMIQVRGYTTNVDHLQPDYRIYSAGVNIDITPASLRESYLMEKN